MFIPFLTVIWAPDTGRPSSLPRHGRKRPPQRRPSRMDGGWPRSFNNTRFTSQSQLLSLLQRLHKSSRHETQNDSSRTARSSRPPSSSVPVLKFLATLFSSDLGISSSSSWPRLGLVPRICSLSLSLFRPLPPLAPAQRTKGSLLALQMNGENVSQLAEAARQ